MALEERQRRDVSFCNIFILFRRAQRDVACHKGKSKVLGIFPVAIVERVMMDEAISPTTWLSILYTYRPIVSSK